MSDDMPAPAREQDDVACLREEIQRLQGENIRLNAENFRITTEVERLTKEINMAKDETTNFRAQLASTQPYIKESLGVVRRLAVDSLTDIQKIELDFVLRTALEDVTPSNFIKNGHGFTPLNRELFLPLVNSLKRMGLLGTAPWYWELLTPSESFAGMIRHSKEYQDTTRKRIDRLQSLRVVGECYLGSILDHADHNPPGLVFDMSLTLLELCRYRGISL